jgi:prevent-host-death family protein
MSYMGRRKWASSTVGIRELRQNLSSYLGRVKKGESLTVTEHGAAVALLRPLATAPTVLGRLAAEGRATAPTRSISELPRPRLARSIARWANFSTTFPASGSECRPRLAVVQPGSA